MKEATTITKHQRATTGQKSMILRRLARRELIPRTLCATDRTGPAWRAIFKVVGVSEPTGANGLFHWPTVDDFIGGLTMNQAHLLIAYLED